MTVTAVAMKNLSVRELARLELAFNSCNDMLLRFFTRRIDLVHAIFGDDALAEEWEIEVKPAAGSSPLRPSQPPSLSDVAPPQPAFC